MFYIRADGNDKIGMGHICRCLSIAEALREQGEEVCFLTADDRPAALIQRRGFSNHILFTYYDEMNVELPQLVLLFSGSSAGKKPRVLIDSYFVTEFYLKNLRLTADVILLDDNKNAVLPCDRLINYNLYAPLLGYEKEYPASTQLLLGSSYVPLRTEFTQHKAVIRDIVQDVLLTTGGGDSCHMALSFVQKLLQEAELSQQLNIHLVCGPFCPDTEKLRELAQTHVFLQVHEGVEQMAELMAACDLAISAAGSTLYELCAVGVPTIGFYFAENQRRNMEAFAAGTPILNAGDFSQDPDGVLDFLFQEIRVLRGDQALRSRISLVMQALVDGQGAKRIAQQLLNTDQKSEE